MSDNVSINLITEDADTGEFVLYLLEDGPWPSGEVDWNDCLIRIQDHILDAFDAVVDGGLAKKYPESVGTKVRIQVDSPSGLPGKLNELIGKIDEFVHQQDNEYGQGLANSSCVSGLRIVTGHSLGTWP
ncbi:hypothetical protein DTL21_09365 [Bremerella cremea]|uniref:Uncharacterized protein n=1 Tax=Blastopirellula marina TaxID=124 RepID=A0A2S8FVB5_9BACT|nr:MULTISPECIES: hypothetical protein [Pirellulaceae]PQO36117.1 hypothetical protein C5Y83_09360 [Blastopirellula marina]RCS48794.1 hypothetical protein DTL21_09365 [Bremerella cremea]